MASDEIRKKWGTIFMGDREASVAELNAMQEPLRREKQQKEQAEDYMERVRLRAADRAREILGAAYAERQKVLEEARAEAATIRKQAQADRAKLMAEGERARKEAQQELARASAEREEAERIRQAAHAEGLETGMQQASAELHEFRAELGSSLGVLMQAIEGQRRKILENWRDDLCELTRCAARAGAGIVLSEEHEKILRSLLYQSLDLLENRSIVTVRVNPADEATVNDLFMAARERFPELRQWVVTADKSVSPGGLVAESGTGSVDLRRENFSELVDGILGHLALPESQDEAEQAASVRALVEREVASIAGMTPELDREPPVSETPPESAPVEPEVAPAPPEEEETEQIPPAPEAEAIQEVEEEFAPQEESPAPPPGDPSLAELEEELFPLDSEPESAPPRQAPAADPAALAEGGFV